MPDLFPHIYLFFGKTTDKVADYLRKVELVSQLKTIEEIAVDQYIFLVTDPKYI